VVIRELGDIEAAQAALIENLQREDLNPVEEALGYRSLIERYSMTQEQVAERVGKSRPAVTNAVRLLALPEPVLELLRDGRISSGHARALLAFSDENQQWIAAKQAESGASVRELERMAKRSEAGEPPPRKKEEKKPPFYTEVELALCAEIGRRVRVLPGAGDGGTVEIEFYSHEDLSDIANRLGRA
jgi:ParB family chromosome partitioning protein